MRVRNTKSITVEEVLLAELHGAIIHPDLEYATLKEYEELEFKGKLSRLPSTILETYHVTMSERIAAFEESCRQHKHVVLYGF